jgi:hypothetical protein
MDIPQQREVLFLGNPFREADEPPNVTAFPAPQHPQPAPSSDRDRRPLPGQPHDNDGVLRDAVVSNWRRDIPPFTRAHTPVLFLVPISGYCSSSTTRFAIR